MSGLRCAICTYLTFLFALCSATPSVGSAADADDADSQRQQFVGPTVELSSPPSWPALRRGRPQAPNILLVMTDDVGFGSSSTFGGPVPTPTLDQLASRGLRYNRFHTTAMCSPTRAALLTGRNATRIGMGAVTDRATGFEGYTTVLSQRAGTIAEILRQDGYSTAMFGKWHLAPLWETGPNGPYDHWPTRMGFDYFYGFMTGSTDQWAPTLYRNLSPIEPPSTDVDYILDRALADEVIHWVRERKSTAPDHPFFIYLAPGTAHSPHHAPAEWMDRFRDKFDQGWDRTREETLARQKALGIAPQSTKLTPRPEVIPSWSSLTERQRRVYAREMEAYTAALSHLDHQVGRIVDALSELGQLENTLIVFVQGDNGSSGEGGTSGAFNENSSYNGVVEDIAAVDAQRDLIGSRFAHSNYPVGWGWAMNAPFKWTKTLASHLGGTRTGLVISWPARIKQAGGVRAQFAHAVDIAPTILAAAKIAFPPVLNGVPQLSVDGIDLSYTFDDAAAPDRRRTQIFTMYDNLAIYHDGWLASTTPHVYPWDLLSTEQAKLKSRQWELYDLNNDFSQATDLARSRADKLREMQDLFWTEAARNNALPINRTAGLDGRPSWIEGRKTFRFAPGITRLLTANAPPSINRSFRIEADIDNAPDRSDGMLATHGGRPGGYGLYIFDNRLVFHYNLAGVKRFEIRSNRALSFGRHSVTLRFDYDGDGRGKGATVTLSEDGVEIGSGRVDQTNTRFYSLDAMFDVGEDTGSPVSEQYQLPFRSSALRELRFML